MVKDVLMQMFCIYGMFEWIICDNGMFWGMGGYGMLLWLEVWFICLGIWVGYSMLYYL